MNDSARNLMRALAVVCLLLGAFVPVLGVGWVGVIPVGLALFAASFIQRRNTP